MKVFDATFAQQDSEAVGGRAWETRLEESGVSAAGLTVDEIVTGVTKILIYQC